MIESNLRITDIRERYVAGQPDSFGITIAGLTSQAQLDEIVGWQSAESAAPAVVTWPPSLIMCEPKSRILYWNSQVRFYASPDEFEPTVHLPGHTRQGLEVLKARIEEWAEWPPDA